MAPPNFFESKIGSASLLLASYNTLIMAGFLFAKYKSQT